MSDSAPAILWRPLITDNIRGLVGTDKPILAVRGDGKGYFGKVVDLTRDWVELANGNQRQIIQLHGNNVNFTVIHNVPGFRVPKMGEKKLPLFGKETSHG